MQRSSLAVAAGVVATLVVGVAIAEGMVLSVESVPVAMLTGLLVGAVVGAVVLIATADRSTPPIHRHVATAAGLFGLISLVVYLGASSAAVANTTSLAAGVVVGGIVGLGVFFWLRENASRQVTAIT